ncbi:MAG: tyrosine-type recombinase/integrase [Nitrospinota bacterium]
MPGIFRQKGRWLAWCRIGGQLVQRLRPTRREAEEILRLMKRRRDLASLGLAEDPKEPGPTVGQAVAAYLQDCHQGGRLAPKTAKGYSDVLRLALLPFLGAARPLAAVTGESLDAYRAARLAAKVRHRARPLSPSTVAKELGIAGTFLRWSWRRGWLPAVPPIRLPKVASRAPEPLSDERLAALLQASHPALRAAILLAVHTGLRAGELLSLRREDIDLKARLLHLRPRPEWTPKSNRPRTIPLNRTAAAALASIPLPPAGPIFLARRGGPMTVKGLSAALQWAAARANLEGVTLHALRHTFGTRLARAGSAEHAISALLGHSSTAMSQRYVHLRPEALRADVERLDRQTDFKRFFPGKGGKRGDPGGTRRGVRRPAPRPSAPHGGRRKGRKRGPRQGR